MAARDEGERVGATVRALRALGLVTEIVVVDDGSNDDTAAEARAAGARVLRTRRNRGKGGALEAALDRIGPADVVLLMDADVGASASSAAALLEPVLSGRADLTVGVLPADPRHGGFGLVKRLARWLVSRAAGFDPAEPLSGQRAVARDVLEGCRPLAHGFGVETAMNIDAARLGARIVEVPVTMEHAYTGRDLRGFVHRATQGVDAVRAAVPRMLRLR